MLSQVSFDCWTILTNIGDIRGLWAVTDEFFSFIEWQVGFSETVDACAVDAVSNNFGSFSPICAEEGKCLFWSECMEEFRVVSEGFGSNFDRETL